MYEMIAEYIDRVWDIACPAAERADKLAFLRDNQDIVDALIAESLAPCADEQMAKRQARFNDSVKVVEAKIDLLRQCGSGDLAALLEDGQNDNALRHGLTRSHAASSLKEVFVEALTDKLDLHSPVAHSIAMRGIGPLDSFTPSEQLEIVLATRNALRACDRPEL